MSGRLRGSGDGARLLAALLLTLAAVLVVVGSVATISVYRVDTGVAAPWVQTTTAWAATSTDEAFAVPAASAAPTGVPLVLGALLAVVAAVLLLRANGRPVDPNPGRMLGVGAAGVVVGGVSVLWIGLLATARDAAARTASFEGGPASDIRVSLEPGVGAYLLLVAALLGLGAAVVLLRRVAGAVAPQWPA